MLIFPKKNVSPIIIPELCYKDRFNNTNSYSEMNPSMFIDEDGDFIILIRCINYKKYKNKEYTIYEDKSNSIYYIAKGKIKNNLLDIENCDYKILEYNYNLPTFFSYWTGLEDIRFINKNTILVNVPELNNFPSIYQAELNNNKIINFIACKPNNKIEKNWMPFIDDNNINKVIYSIDPFIIKSIQEDDFEEINISNEIKEKLKDYHGSTNGIEFKNNYNSMRNSHDRIFLIHKNEKETLHRWLIFNIETRKVIISEEFKFYKNSYIEFNCSLNRYNERFFITIGVNDNKAYIIETCYDDIINMFNNNFKTLFDYNKNIFTVYHFENKIRYGPNCDSGYVIGKLNINYDCFISAGISNNDDFSLFFINDHNLNKINCFGFDGTIEKIPDNLIEKITFVKKNIGYLNDDKTTNLKYLIEKYDNIFIKMDIEGWEWEWFLSLNDTHLNKITQLVIEIHGITNYSWHNNFNINSFNCTPFEKYKCLEKLTKTHYLIHAHGSNHDIVYNKIPNVIELTYINKKMFKEIPKLNTKSLPALDLDFQNDINFKEIDLNFEPFVNTDTIFFLTEENPFLINIIDKDEYSYYDYLNIEEQLNNKNIKINKIIENLYSNSFYKIDDFKKRITKGINQKLIDTSNNLLPIKKLFKLGNGGDGTKCFVCCTSLECDSRLNASKQIIKSLENVNYHGHFYLFTGGFPNPTGTEMKYVGVPYCFKIFMMLEAQKLGFNKIIWIDSGCYALNNPDYLFDLLSKNNIIGKAIYENNNFNNMIFKEINKLLNKIIKCTLNNDSIYLETIIFGLNLDSDIVQNLIKEYYEMVKIGWTFFSIFPEEIVLSSLLNKPEYKELVSTLQNIENYKLQIHETKLSENIAKENQFYFHHKDYSKYINSLNNNEYLIDIIDSNINLITENDNELKIN